MPITVNIEGYGLEQFPDEMPLSEIKRRAIELYQSTASFQKEKLKVDPGLYEAGDEKSFTQKLGEAFPEKPLIPSKTIQKIIEWPVGGTNNPYVEGLSNSIASLISPRAAAIAGGVATAPAAAMPAIAGGFVPVAAGGAYEAGKQAIKDVGEGQYRKAATHGTESAVQTGMAVLAGAGALHKTGTVKTPRGDIVEPNRPPPAELDAAVEAKLREAYGAAKPQEIVDAVAKEAGAEPPKVEMPQATHTGYVGSGRAQKGSVYNADFADSPVLGDALYMAPDEATASAYGPNVRPVAANIKNPLVVTNDVEWRAVTKAAGLEFPNPLSFTSPEVTNANVAKLRTHIEKSGHDGVVIKMDPRGDNAKTLRNVFDHDQVIAFGGEVKPPVPVSETTGNKITLAPDATPTTVVHEVKHAIADQGKGPHPPEDNAAIAAEFVGEKPPAGAPPSEPPAPPGGGAEGGGGGTSAEVVAKGFLEPHTSAYVDFTDSIRNLLGWPGRHGQHLLSRTSAAGPMREASTGAARQQAAVKGAFDLPRLQRAASGQPPLAEGMVRVYRNDKGGWSMNFPKKAAKGGEVSYVDVPAEAAKKFTPPADKDVSTFSVDPNGYERFHRMMTQEQLNYEKTLSKTPERIQDVMPPDEYAAAQADPAMQAARDIYKKDFEPIFQKAQQMGGGKLKELETYFPLHPERITPELEGWRKFVAEKWEGVKKSLGVDRESTTTFGSIRGPMMEGPAPGEHTRTGILAPGQRYSMSPDVLLERLVKSYKFMGEVGFRQALKDAGVAISLPEDVPHPSSFPVMVNGVRKNVAIHIEPEAGGRYTVMPKQVWSEAKKVLGKGTPEEFDLEALRAATRLLTNIQLIGPFDFTFHNANQIGSIVALAPYLGKDPATAVLGATPLTRMPDLIYKLSKEAPSQELLMEMAQQGLLSSRFGEVKGDVIGNAAAMKKLMYGPAGIEARSRAFFYRLGQELGLKPQELYEWTNQLGNYNFEMKSTLGRLVTKAGVGPFYEAGSSMLMNGFGALIGKTGANSTAARVVGQQIGGGLSGQIATWAIGYKMFYDKYPWEDPEAKFLAFPIGKDENGEVTYLSLAALNPIPERGSRVTGIRGAFETGVSGGTPNQAAEAALKDSINALLHPLLGPAPEYAAGLAGRRTYLTDLFKGGRLNVEFGRSYGEKHSDIGAAAGENIKDATIHLIQLLSMADDERRPLWQVPVDVVAPRLIQRANPEKRIKRVGKEKAEEENLRHQEEKAEEDEMLE